MKSKHVKVEKLISLTDVVVLFYFPGKSVAFFFKDWETPQHKVLCSPGHQRGCDSLFNNQQ